MRRPAFTLSVCFSVLLVADTGAMSPWAEAPSPASPTERLIGVLSTSSQMDRCARVGSDCTFRTCCDDRKCRRNGNGDASCR